MDAHHDGQKSDLKIGLTGLGLALVWLFCVAAFFAPPFSGLDTLPALGVVLISLGVLLEDAAFIGAGTVVGTGGVGLAVTLGARAAEYVRDLF